MIPTPSNALETARAITLGKLDSHLCQVEAGVLLALIGEAEDHAQCSSDSETEIAELRKEHEAEVSQISTAARDLIAAVEAMLKIGYGRVDDALNELKAQV